MLSSTEWCRSQPSEELTGGWRVAVPGRTKGRVGILVVNHFKLFTIREFHRGRTRMGEHQFLNSMDECPSRDLRKIRINRRIRTDRIDAGPPVLVGPEEIVVPGRREAVPPDPEEEERRVGRPPERAHPAPGPAAVRRPTPVNRRPGNSGSTGRPSWSRKAWGSEPS